MSASRLLEKYDIPAPRYTSYPTVPYWEAELSPAGVQIIETGKGFLRNICLAFDARYWAKAPKGRVFSRSV